MALAVPPSPRIQTVSVVHNVKDHDSRECLAWQPDCAPAPRPSCSSGRVGCWCTAVSRARPCRGCSRARCGSSSCPGIGAFEEGHADAIGASPLPDDVFVCLGEMRPSKNYEDAIRAAELSGQPLVIAGAAVEQDYFDAARRRWSPSSTRRSPSSPSSSTPEASPASSRPAAPPSSRTASLPPSQAFSSAEWPQGAPIISADLPALVEQAAGRPEVSFYPAGDVRGPGRPHVRQPRRASAQRGRRWTATPAGPTSPPTPSTDPRHPLPSGAVSAFACSRWISGRGRGRRAPAVASNARVMVNRSSTRVRAFAASRSRSSRRHRVARRSRCRSGWRTSRQAPAARPAPPASAPEPTTSRMPATSVTTSEPPAAAASRTNSDMPSQRDAITTTSAAASHDGTSRLSPRAPRRPRCRWRRQRVAVGAVADEVEPRADDRVPDGRPRRRAAGPGPSAGSAARR